MRLIQTILQHIEDNNLRQQVLDLYKEYGGRQKVADLLDCSYGTVGHVIKALGCDFDRHSRRSLQKYHGKVRNPFDGSDFGDYLIGYIIGDGSILVKDGRVCGVSISSSDLEHITAIRDMWDTNLTVYGPNKGNYTVSCYDSSIAEILMSYGVVPSKSKLGMRLTIPITSAMFRGLFDSDGSVSDINRGLSRRLMLAGGRDYIPDFVEAVGVTPHYQDRKTFICAYYYSRHDVETIRDYMYKDATIYLKRKHDRLYF